MLTMALWGWGGNFICGLTHLLPSVLRYQLVRFIFFVFKLCWVVMLISLLLFWSSNQLPPSPQEYPISGLNLLRLLVQNRSIALFHPELELLWRILALSMLCGWSNPSRRGLTTGCWLLDRRCHERLMFYFMGLLANAVRYICLVLCGE